MILKTGQFPTKGKMEGEGQIKKRDKKELQYKKQDKHFECICMNLFALYQRLNLFLI